MSSVTTLFNHYADIPALQNEKQEVLNIFAEIRSGIKSLTDAGFKIDTAKTVTQMKSAVNDINKLQDQLIAKNRELELFEQRMENLRQKNLETQLRIEKVQNDIAVRQSQQAKLKAQEEQARTSSLIEQEKELDKLIAKEEKRNELSKNTSSPVGIVDRGLSVQGVGEFPKAPLTNISIQQDSIIEAREAVNDLEKAEVGEIISANEWASTHKKVSEEVKQTGVQVAEVTGRFDEFTGSLRANVEVQVENTVALQKIKSEQASINKEIKGQGGIASQEQISTLSSLKQQELQLTAANKDLNTTLKQQVIALRDNEGAAAQLRAEFTLLKQTYENMTAAERVTSFGKLTKQNIDTLAPVVSDLDKQMLRGRHGLDTLDSGIEKAGKRLVSFVTRDLFRAVAGFFVFTLAFEVGSLVIEKFIQWINKMSDAEVLAFQKLQDMNDVMKNMSKEAGTQISDLKLLRDAAQDANLPLETRLKAIKGLKDEFPDYYKQLNNEVILLGKDKEAYDGATEAILRNATAKAAKTKIDELESQRLDVAFQKAKIIGTTEGEAKRAKKPENFVPGIVDEKGKIIGGVGGVLSTEEQLAAITDRRTKALKEQGKTLESIDQREQFLLQFVDKKSLVDTIVKPDKKTGTDPTDSNYYRLLIQEQKSAEEYKKFLQQEAIEEQKLIANNESINVGIRIKARERETEIEKQLLGEETEAKLKEIDYAALKEKERKKITQKEIDLIDKDAQNKRNLIQEDALKKLGDLEAQSSVDIIKIKKQAYDKEIQDYKDFLARQEQLNQEAIKKRKEEFETRSGSINQTKDIKSTVAINATQEVVSKLDPIKDKEKIKLEYKKLEEELINIELERQEKSIQNEIEYWRSVLQTTSSSTKEYIEAEQKFSSAEERLAELRVKREKDITNRISKAHEDLVNSYKKLEGAVKDAAKSALDATYDRQINKIQTQIDLVDQLKEAEITRITQSKDAETDKAAKIAIVEAKAQADKEALQRRQKQIDREKAKFDKAFQAFNIVEEGIKTVAAIKLKVHELIVEALVNPAKAPLVPLAAAQIPIAIATQAASLAAVLAQPLPAYWKGTMSSAAGLATVAEKGPELAKEPTGRLVMYESPTIAKLMKGTKIWTADETKAIIRANYSDQARIIYNYAQPTSTAPDDRQLKELQKLNKKDNKPTVVVNVERGIEATLWYFNQFKS